MLGTQTIVPFPFKSLAGTGGKMQCTSYLLGCATTKDLNSGANGNTWPIYYSNGIWRSGNFCNVLLPTFPTNRNPGFDKEVFSQTMVKHEATFRDQVQELHRLYRRQRELMDEIKLREQCKHHLELQTLQPNPFFTQISSELGQKMGHISSLPGENTAGSRSYELSAEHFQEFLSFVERKNMKADSEPSLCEFPSAKSKNSGKRMFDLELPADEYIGSEEEEQLEEKNAREKVPCYPPTNKRISASGEFNYIGQGGSFCTDSFSRETKDSVNFNEPIQLDDTATQNSTTALGLDTCHVEIPYQSYNLSGILKSCFEVLNKEIVHTIEAGKGFEDSSKLRYLERDKQHATQAYYDEAGRSGSNLNSLIQVSPQQRLSVSCVESQGHGHTTFNLLDKVDREMWRGRTNLALKISERNHDLGNDNDFGLVSFSVSTSNQHPAQSYVAKSQKSSVTSQRKPIHNLRHIPIALPCFDTRTSFRSTSKSSSIDGPEFNGNKIHLNRNSTWNPSFGSVNSLPSSLSFDSQSESIPLSTSLNPLNRESRKESSSEHNDLAECVKGSICQGVNCMKDVDLNSMPPSCLADPTISRENIRLTGGKDKFEDSLDGLRCFRATPHYNGKLNNETIHSTGMVSVFSHPYPSENEDIWHQKKIRVLDSSTTCDSTLNSIKFNRDDLVLESGGLNKLSNFGNPIDLNSHIIEDESSLAPADPISNMKAAVGMDLEVSISPENKECSPHTGESEEHEHEAPLQMLKQEEEKHVKAAAEAIVLISSSKVQLFLDNPTCEKSEASSDCIHWFAGIVSSMARDEKNEVETVSTGAADGDRNENFPGGIDYFEAMTLKLTEMKVEENCCKSNDPRKNEPRATLLSSQRMMCRTRKAKQQKDFQTKALYGLPSQSRHEVIEDPRTMGGLMGTDCILTKTGSRRRNVGKNRCAKGRKQSSISPSNGVEITSRSRFAKELDFGEIGHLTGWGKNNRRLRGLRFSASK